MLVWLLSKSTLVSRKSWTSALSRTKKCGWCSRILGKENFCLRNCVIFGTSYINKIHFYYYCSIQSDNKYQKGLTKSRDHRIWAEILVSMMTSNETKSSSLQVYCWKRPIFLCPTYFPGISESKQNLWKCKW